MITRTVLAVDLKDEPGLVERYLAHHRDVWPEVRTSLRRAGILNMDIYLLGRRLIMVVDTDGQDYRRCFARHAPSPRRRMGGADAIPPAAGPRCTCGRMVGRDAAGIFSDRRRHC
jgi:L-rhamnose mutarotase